MHDGALSYYALPKLVQTLSDDDAVRLLRELEADSLKRQLFIGQLVSSRRKCVIPVVKARFSEMFASDRASLYRGFLENGWSDLIEFAPSDIMSSELIIHLNLPPTRDWQPASINRIALTYMAFFVADWNSVRAIILPGPLTSLHIKR
jgi:hypothetical protein